ncbi:MAG: dihydropyrimidinase [Deltaproteobacteria bacterium]|nr:dihydropyrimidinase [Deltaproteobacteria bacterium]
MGDLAIVGGKLISAGRQLQSDLVVSQQKILRIGRLGKKARSACSRVIDAKGCLVIPGAIDPHVHLQLTIGPGLTTNDDFDSGTRAAAAGGVTSLIDYTTPAAGQNPLSAFKARRRLADRQVNIDYSLHNVLIGWRPNWVEKIKELVKLGAPSVKLFMIYKERGWQADDGRMLAVMESCKNLGVTVCVHAENDDLIEKYTKRARQKPKSAAQLAAARPALVEEEAAERAIELAKVCGARLHLVHLSTAAAAAAVGRARRAGHAISGETCPQYLLLDKRKLSGKDGHLWGCCPVLRGKKDRLGLLVALQRGWLQAIGTDHCTFNRRQKDSWGKDFEKIPYGLPGVETSLALTFTLGPGKKKLSLAQWVKLHSEGPARLFGLYPQKGVLRKGSDADIVVWDPHQHRKIDFKDLQTDCDWNPYQAMTVRGIARHVLLRGTEIAREGKYIDSGQAGCFIRRKT